jgi:hypothetical protein
MCSSTAEVNIETGRWSVGQHGIEKDRERTGSDLCQTTVSKFVLKYWGSPLKETQNNLYTSRTSESEQIIYRISSEALLGDELEPKVVLERLNKQWEQMTEEIAMTYFMKLSRHLLEWSNNTNVHSQYSESPVRIWTEDYVNASYIPDRYFNPLLFLNYWLHAVRMYSPGI